MKKIFFFLCCILVTVLLSGQGDPTIAETSGKFCIDEDAGMLYTVYPNQGIAAYDISNSTNPRILGFIELEGVIDLAVRNSYIFANQYDDLVVLKVDWEQESHEELARQNNVFPNRANNDKNNEQIRIANNEEFEEAASIDELIPTSLGGASGSSTQGSMSCLTLKGNYLYAVSESELMTFDADITSKELLKNVSIIEPETSDLETIFLSENSLFLGSKTGMYIYDITNRNETTPQQLSKFDHAESCDPVIVKDNIAYITTRTARTCSGGTDQLIVVNVSNPARPSEIFRTAMTNPHGLSISDQNQLYICDGEAGLRVMNATTPRNINQIGQVRGISTYDVICDTTNELVIVSTTEGWDIYNNNARPSLLSRISRKPAS